jgi:hypothetical protein
MRLKALAHTTRWVATQGKDMANTCFPVLANHCVYLVLGGVNTGEVGYGFEASFIVYAFDRVERTISRGATGAIGNGHKFRIDCFKPLQSAPESFFRVTRLGREEFK